MARKPSRSNHHPDLTKTYHRSSLTPGQDLTGQPAQVVAIANTVWTPEVISAYQAMLAAQANRLSGE
jgi:hypothetical protein